MNPAEELRAAASLLRDTAAKAFKDRAWENHEDDLWIGGPVWGYRIQKLGTLTEADSAWIALAQPRIAEPLAAWLEKVATDHEISMQAHAGSVISPHNPALAVARAICPPADDAEVTR
ncbi:hypothetical protein ACGFNU_21715 [Spirillospora sp. NPDC048911]|uniref:hypothetical protein n=1 Tax=Spirillospora sp. NPDC048911 TaxID=3364527 RepID=UPI003723D1F3